MLHKRHSTICAGATGVKQKDDMETYVENLNGYFQSLRRLSNNSCDLWAEGVLIESTLEESLEAYFKNIEGLNIIEKHWASFSEIESLYKELIYSQISGLSVEVLELLKWDVIEYYGLISTSIDPEGSFNPLVNTGALLLEAKSSFHFKCNYYVVEYGKFAVITGLAQRA
jgi:hypothetical protein